MVWRVMIAIGIAFIVAWAAFVVALFVVRPKGSLIKEAARILPDTLRLLRRLASDGSLPRGVRIRLWLLFAYLASPIDLVPDFIPILGYADDAIIVAAMLRSVVRRAGPEAVRTRWPGTSEGLAVLWRVARLPDSPGPDTKP